MMQTPAGAIYTPAVGDRLSRARLFVNGFVNETLRNAGIEMRHLSTVWTALQC